MYYNNISKCVYVKYVLAVSTRRFLYNDDNFSYDTQKNDLTFRVNQSTLNR